MIQCSVCATVFSDGRPALDATIYGCINCQMGEWTKSLAIKTNESGIKTKRWIYREIKGWGYLGDIGFKYIKLRCLQKRIQGKYNSELYASFGFGEPYRPRTSSKNALQFDSMGVELEKDSELSKVRTPSKSSEKSIENIDVKEGYFEGLEQKEAKL